MASAQTLRPVLLARATATSIFGLRATILASHGSVISPRRIAFWTTAMAPMIKSRLRSRWPIFDILPSLGLPPVVCCRGTRPSHAEKSRPRRKLSIGGAKACSAIAVIGPIPGIVISRAVSSPSRALARISRSSPSIFSSSSSIRSSNSLPSSTTASGRPQSPSSSTPASCLIRALPCGATTPRSAWSVAVQLP